MPQQKHKKYNKKNKMMQYVCATEYHCVNCRREFVCIGSFSLGDYSDKVMCELCKVEHRRCVDGSCKMCCKNYCNNQMCLNCDQRHRRCSDDDCDNCCRMSECDAVICSRCVELNVECERSIPLTSDDFHKCNFMRYSVSQFESCPRTFRVHLQAYFQLSKRMRMTAIKKSLSNKSIHLEMAQGSFEEASNYCKAEFVQKKGTYGELEEENYELIDGEKKRKRVNDPNVYFEFGTPLRHRSLRDSNDDNDDEERLNYINDNASSLTFSEIATNDDIRPRAWMNSAHSAKLVFDEIKKLNEIKIKRFWKPMVFYIYGPGGSGKSGLVTELFSDVMYSKSSKDRSGGKNWWNGYENQPVVLLDEFYTKISWSDMVNLLNDTDYEVENKYGSLKPFTPRYVFLTSTQSPRNAYSYKSSVGEDDNKRSFEQFDRRIDFVIRLDGKWSDVLSERTTELFVEKGGEDDFRNMHWSIKYRKQKNTIDELKEKVKDVNKDIDGEVFVKNRQVYFREKFPDYMISYLRDYPLCGDLSDYKEGGNSRIQIDENISSIDDMDDVIPCYGV